MSLEGNPLLNYSDLPNYSAIQPQHLKPAISAVIAKNRAIVNEILNQNQAYTWGNLLSPLEQISDNIQRVLSPVEHLNAVMNSQEMREVYNECLPQISEYFTDLAQNKTLYEAVLHVSQSPEFLTLSAAKQKAINNELRDFRLAGVHLTEDKKERFKELQQQLSQLTHHFEQHVLDATNAFEKMITDEAWLVGLPSHTIAQARQTAAEKHQPGYILTLQAPCFLAVMTYSQKRELREEFYRAYVTLASEFSSNSEWDNTPIMHQILCARQELAELVGYQHYAEYSLATKMAKSTDEVMSFLLELAEKVMPFARAEVSDLQDFAKRELNLITLESWDISYVSEELRKYKHNFSQEELRPYFPLPKVLEGLFHLVNRLYNVSFKEIKNIPTWHADVVMYGVYDAQQQCRGKIFLDLFARANKRSGAWVDDCQNRYEQSPGVWQIPVVYLVCNFTPKVADEPALLEHEELVTLFHEFGHALHHLLSTADAAFVAGTHGVAWDAVELPSQFMENWCYQKEILHSLSGHYQTQKNIPDELIEKILQAKNFHAGIQTVRQLVYSLFDFEIHRHTKKKITKTFIQETAMQILRTYSVMPIVSYNRFPNSFGHIFAGGYAAGYYSYKWAEVLSSDAFARFEEEGLFNPQVGHDFLHYILEPGGSMDAEDLFIKFRGRKAKIDALLRHQGLSALR